MEQGAEGIPKTAAVPTEMGQESEEETGAVAVSTVTPTVLRDLKQRSWLNEANKRGLRPSEVGVAEGDASWKGLQHAQKMGPYQLGRNSELFLSLPNTELNQPDQNS